jgi:hypothetical protein
VATETVDERKARFLRESVAALGWNGDDAGNLDLDRLWFAWARSGWRQHGPGIAPGR